MAYCFFNGEGVAAGLIFQRMVLPVKINKKCSGNHESAECSHLCTLKAKSKVDIISTEVLKEKAKQGIQHHIEADNRASGALFTNIPDEKNKDEEVTLTFPYLSRP